MKYGARHLKRAIERSPVHPLSNLIASSQVDSGDLVRVDYDPASDCLIFVKEAGRNSRLDHGADDRSPHRIAA